MDNVAEFLKRAAQQTGFERASYTEKRIPTDYNNIVVIPFFGDINSTFLLASLLLKRFKESKPNKYFILCSWPGFQHLFPYVDEYWYPKDSSNASVLASNAEPFGNTCDINTNITRSLNNRFEHVMTSEQFFPYYNKGLQHKFWDEFKSVKRYLPAVPSSVCISEALKVELSKRDGHKVVIYPARKVRSRQAGRTINLMAQKDFWVCLVNRLLKEGITPVIYQNAFTHDLSRDFAEKCVYLVSNNLGEILASMRYVGCVLDIHTGISRLAIAARCPFVAVDERVRYIEDRDCEVDDLCCDRTPKHYIFSFSTLLMTGTDADWNSSIIDNIVSRLNKFIPAFDRETWGSTTESDEFVSYDIVRKRKIKRLGMNFIRKY